MGTHSTRPPRGRKPYRGGIADCHVHLTDFFQRGEGIGALLSAMDRARVEHAMVCGMPLVKRWSADRPDEPGYYLDDGEPCYWYSATDVLVAREVEALPPGQRARVHPFISGLNGTDRNAVDHVRRMLEWYPGLWEGVGEVMARHDALSHLTAGDTPRPDSPALDPVYELAGELDLPIALHSNITTASRRKPAHLQEIERLAARHEDTRLIWCHAGVSRELTVPKLASYLRCLLDARPNVFLDLSWVVYDDYVIRDGAPGSEWLELIEAHPDRFMVGSDTTGHFADYGATIRRYDLLLNALAPETARRVGRDNFLDILPAKTSRRAVGGPRCV